MLYRFIPGACLGTADLEGVWVHAHIIVEGEWECWWGRVLPSVRRAQWTGTLTTQSCKWKLRGHSCQLLSLQFFWSLGGCPKHHNLGHCLELQSSLQPKHSFSHPTILRVLFVSTLLKWMSTLYLPTWSIIALTQRHPDRKISKHPTQVCTIRLYPSTSQWVPLLPVPDTTVLFILPHTCRELARGASVHSVLYPPHCHTLLLCSPDVSDR